MAMHAASAHQDATLMAVRTLMTVHAASSCGIAPMSGAASLAARSGAPCHQGCPCSACAHMCDDTCVCTCVCVRMRVRKDVHSPVRCGARSGPPAACCKCIAQGAFDALLGGVKAGGVGEQGRCSWLALVRLVCLRRQGVCGLGGLRCEIACSCTSLQGLPLPVLAACQAGGVQMARRTHVF